MESVTLHPQQVKTAQIVLNSHVLELRFGHTSPESLLIGIFRKHPDPSVYAKVLTQYFIGAGVVLIRKVAGPSSVGIPEATHHYRYTVRAKIVTEALLTEQAVAELIERGKTTLSDMPLAPMFEYKKETVIQELEALLAEFGPRCTKATRESIRKQQAADRMNQEARDEMSLTKHEDYIRLQIAANNCARLASSLLADIAVIERELQYVHNS